MKKLSVKQRVVLFTAGIMVLMVMLVYGILRWSSVHQAERYGSETLRQASRDAEDEIKLRDGMLVLDRDLADIDYASIQIYDSTGRMQYYGPIPAFDAPLAEGKPRRVMGDEGRIWYVYDVLHPVSDSVSVWIRSCMRMDSVMEVENHVHKVFLFMILPLCALGIVGGHLITRRAFAPMTQMAEAAERIAGGDDLKERIGLKNEDEFGKLSQVLDDMLARLEAAFRQEKLFTANASHELRTPLAVIRSQCELGLQEDNDPRAAIMVIAEQEKRLSRLVKELLLLSRMDAHTEKLTLERVDLSALMEAAAEELMPAAQERGLAIKMDISPNCILMGDELRLIGMLVNLLENALRYASSVITVSLCRGADHFVGTVRDDGPGIPPEHLPYIFQRFYQADPARSRESGSSGIGLSLAEWTAKAHGGYIEAQNDGGAVFRFRLPAGTEQS